MSCNLINYADSQNLIFCKLYILLGLFWVNVVIEQGLAAILNAELLLLLLELLLVLPNLTKRSFCPYEVFLHPYPFLSLLHHFFLPLSRQPNTSLSNSSFCLSCQTNSREKVTFPKRKKNIQWNTIPMCI